MTHPASSLMLLLRSGNISCALPVSLVIEVMRPLPVEPLEGAPEFVCGLSIIRGAPAPVVDLRVLLSTPSARPPERFVRVRTGNRPVVLAVDAVYGVRALSALPLSEMPPLLGEAHRETIESLSVLDAELLLVLKTCGVVPAEVWNRLPSREEPV